MRKARFTIQPRDTESGIDFSARSRSGLVNVDYGVERGPEDAASREEAWRKLAEQAEVENIDDYFFRYGNVVVAYEQVPSESDRAPVERCLSMSRYVMREKWLAFGDDSWIEDESGERVFRVDGKALRTAQDPEARGRRGQRALQDPGAQAASPRHDGDRGA